MVKRAPTRIEEADQGGLDVAGVRLLFQDRYATTVRLGQFLTGNAVAGEDIAQEAFAILCRQVDRLNRPGDLGGYLHRMVVNLARSAGRRQRVARRHSTRRPDPSAEAADHAEAVAERDVILAALSRLPVRQRQCLVLRYYLDLAEADIAATLGVSIGSVKTHTARGLAGLSRLLGERP